MQPLLLAARASCDRGGYGIITSVQLPNGTPAVVKQLRTDRAASTSRAATLVSEVSSLELLPPHANVVTLLGYCWQSVGVYALVYERASHGDLGSAVALKVLNSPELMAAALADAGRGLAHMHAHGMVHADVKESNILVWVDANGVRAKLADFGLCSALRGEAFVVSGAGTPGYIAPEVTAGTTYVASDVYSFSVTIARALLNLSPSTLWHHGCRYRVGDAAAEQQNRRIRELMRSNMHAHFGERAVLGIVKEADRLVDCCLRAARSSMDQRPSLDELINALEAFVKR